MTGNHLRDYIKKQKKVLLIILIICIAGGLLALYTNNQTSRIKRMLNESAYRNMKSTLVNLENMLSNELSGDARELQLLASGCSDIDDLPGYVETLECPSYINGIYYGGIDDDTAVGKNGTTLELHDLEFAEHKDGLVRSRPYMTKIANFAYVVKIPIEKEGETVGYLYAEYSLTRFDNLLPRDETIEGNDYSILDSQTMRYVYTPVAGTAGTHINFKRLGEYLTDKELAEPMLEDIREVLGKRTSYYMKIVTMKNIYDKQQPSDYVLFLWPIDDGEYYLTGFVRLDSLQAERIDVERTIQLLLLLVVGFALALLALVIVFLGSSLKNARTGAKIQKKHNQELNEALQIARAANKSKSNFLSNMSHDIRTPMNAIIGFTTLLSRETTDPLTKEYADKILSAGKYLLNLINDILDLSKIESGKTRLTVSEFSIRKLAQDVSTLVQVQVEERHQRLTATVEDIAYDHVWGDELRVHQVLMNILSNAVKYTPDGGKIDFTIRGIPQSKQNYQKLQITIADNGYGISEENLPTIFDAFTRVEDASAGQVQGTGLGLAIVKNIVDLMGGTISVESEVGKGSCFMVELAFLIAEQKQEDQNRSTPENLNLPAEEISLEGMHILAAEDNELNAEILVELLKMEGAECLVCENGKKTVEAFEHSPADTFDLILMDIQMPVMNGYDAARAIRRGSHPQAGTISIIAMTANAFAEDKQEALKAGMDAHVAKPLDIGVLKDTIHAVRKQKGERE